MPSETIIKLGQLSKKSPQSVEQTYNSLMDQMKKSNSIYKRYEQQKDPLQKNKLYGEFMASFMLELKKKLGIQKDLQVEDVGGINTGNMGSATTATGEKAPYGSSAIYASKMGMVSRAGSIKKNKKKKKHIRESEEYINNLLMKGN
jgi:hypothetical protein